MFNKIFKVSDEITKEEILGACKYAPTDEDIETDRETIFSYDKFMYSINHFHISDYDGEGYLMIDGVIIENAIVWINQRTVYFENILFVPLNVLYNIFGDSITFVWYNK